MVQALVDPPLAKMNRYRDRHDGTVIVFVIVISLSLVIVLSLSPCRFRVSLSSFLSHYRYCRIVLSLSLSRHRYRVIVIASSWSHYSSRVIVFWAELPWTGLLIADRRSQLDMARLQKRVFRKKLDLIWSDDLFCWGLVLRRWPAAFSIVTGGLAWPGAGPESLLTITGLGWAAATAAGTFDCC